MTRSHINSNLYHYGANNPVHYIDPDGKFSISIGWTNSAGAGTQGSVTNGIVIAFSKEHGLSFGKYSSISTGSQIGYGVGTGVKITFDSDTKKVESGVSETLDIGGSASVPATPLSAGGEISIDLDNGNLSLSPCILVGTGSNEVHATYSITNTENTSEAFDKAISDYNTELENMYLDYFLEYDELIDY